MRILLVEDEKRMAQALCEILRLEKYDVDHYDNGTDGLAAIESNIYDIVILDVMLPGMDGYEVAKKTRLKGITTPILMLTARAELDDKVTGLDLGADDYIVKPFSPREVVARVKAILRRVEVKAQSKDPNLLSYNGLTIDLNSYTVTLRGEKVICTPKEIEILYMLASNPGQVFTRDTLLSRVWGYDFAGETRTVDTHIKRLRAKLDSEGLGWSIKTIYGVGYKFELENA